MSVRKPRPNTDLGTFIPDPVLTPIQLAAAREGARMTAEAMRFRRQQVFNDSCLWNGACTSNGVPRGALILRLRYWSLPLSISFEGHVIQRIGVTVGVGPLYFSWSFI